MWDRVTQFALLYGAAVTCTDTLSACTPPPSPSPAADAAALCDFKCIEYFRALNDDDATTMMTMMLPGYVCGYGCGDAEHCVYYHRHGDVSRCVASRSSDLPFVSGLFI